MFKANVHKQVVTLGGQPVRVAICTRLRTQLRLLT
jgi:hypothetical protein